MLLELFPFLILNNAMAFVYAYFYAPNFEKMGSILLSACPSVRSFVCQSVQKKFKARVLKFHIWIPRQKIAYSYF